MQFHRSSAMSFSAGLSVLTIALTCGACISAARAEPAGPGEVRGLRAISDAPFPTPADTKAIPLPGGDFETAGKPPSGWTLGNAQVVIAGDAPQGKAYCRLAAHKGPTLRTPLIGAEGGRPYFLSFWLRSPAEDMAMVTFTSDDKVQTFTGENPGIPSTANQWKHVGIYFWMPTQCKTIQFHIAPKNEETQSDQFISVDDFHLRTASEAEFFAAYAAERSHLPPYDIAPRPGDGANLALSVAKWEGRAGIPGKPFVIWALGSSWTDAQKNGDGLIRAIRERFPQAPPIIYKVHAGSGTPWQYAWGWVKQFVAVEEPDLVFTYTVGSPEGLDAMLTEVRRRTTADIIVPSIHFSPKSTMTPEDIENGYVSWQKVREICQKHGAEFVENRRELADYMKRENLKADDLLWDHVHQGLHGRFRVWDSVGRHITKADQFAYAPESRERRIAISPAPKTATEEISISGSWKLANGVATTGERGAKVKVRFTGNRIDLLGRKMPGGGSVRVLIDGIPGDQAPVFASTFIVATQKTWPGPIKSARNDCAPHAVDLGDNVVPQSWTITTTSDVGDYRIEGSVTGADGEGNVARPFRSRSGQIGIDPIHWRHGRDERGGKVIYGNVTGDKFNFDVYRSSRGEVSLRADRPEATAENLAKNLTNGEHTVEIIAAGDGEVSLEGLYVYQPPEKQ